MTLSGKITNEKGEPYPQTVILLLFDGKGVPIAFETVYSQYRLRALYRGPHVLIATTGQSRLFRREVQIETQSTSLDIQLEPIGPPHSVNIVAPPEPPPSKSVRCLQCGHSVSLKWLQDPPNIPAAIRRLVPSAFVRIGMFDDPTTERVKWMHRHHQALTGPPSYWPTEIIIPATRPEDLKKAAAEEMYLLIVKLQEYLRRESLWPMIYDNEAHTATPLRQVIDAVLAKARGESPDA